MQELTTLGGMGRGQTGAILGISIGVAKGRGQTGAILGISIGVAADTGVEATVTDSAAATLPTTKATDATASNAFFNE